MKRVSILVSILCAYSISMAFAQVNNPTLLRVKRSPLSPRTPPSPNAPHLATAPSPRWPASTTSKVIPATCPPEAGSALCGYVRVPLDREHPNLARIRIYFELHQHSGPGPAESAILADLGGPGATTTGLRDFFLFIFGANLDKHDFLLIDDRGRGLSNTIDCEELQHATAPFDVAEAACASQLGNAVSRYGTGDIAQDTEAVRAALGYDKVDYYGGSYGGVDVTAYATRFGEHLRSIVLDAPAGAPDLKAFQFEQYRTQAMTRVVQLACLRSPTCSADHSDAADLVSLIDAIRRHPIEGDAYDASGNLVHVRIDEEVLLSHIIANPTGNFASTGEILAAATALSRGDARPLLRLGAEQGFVLFDLSSDYGDPSFFSIGAHYATACMDFQIPWEWSASVAMRMEQYSQAVSELPENAFAPFSKHAATGLSFSFYGSRCLWWQKPTPPSPVVPWEEGGDDQHNASANDQNRKVGYPTVPTLVLTGDLDNLVPLEATSKVAALFPNSVSITIPEAGHVSSGWSQCARDLGSHFVETLQVGDTSCANTPETVFPAVGRFPLFANQARAADVDSNGRNQIGPGERKVVRVAVAAVIDALQRGLIGFANDGAGLRAGTFHNDLGDPAWTLTLTGCAFAKDVSVSGIVVWRWGIDSSLTADLQVSGPGTAGGTLHVEGKWQAPGPVGQFTVSGTLGGRQVAVLVPEA